MGHHADICAYMHRYQLPKKGGKFFLHPSFGFVCGPFFLCGEWMRVQIQPEMDLMEHEICVSTLPAAAA